MKSVDPTRPARPHRRLDATRGQILVIFAFSIFVFISLTAVVVDVSWFWSNELRMQRAADAAALAGVVHLPGDVANAVIDAKAEAAKNGYTDGVNTVIVTAWQDPTNARRLRVTVEARVGTFFARVIGINSFPGAAQAKADYVLPVPMGSPENYYGVFGTIRHPGGGITTTTPHNNTTTGYFTASSAPTGTWTTPGNTITSNDAWATSITANQYQTFGGFNIALNSTVSNIDGIELTAEMSKTGTGASCQIQFELSPNNTSSWTTGAGTGVKLSPVLTTTDTSTVVSTATDLWGKAGGWSASELSNTNFWVRARVIKTSVAACAAAAVVRIDQLRVRVQYDYNTSTFTPDVNVASPYGAALTPRGFWGVMLTQGADNVNGDAYLPYYDQSSSSTVSTNYNASDYYDYAIEMPAGSSAGEVWIFDPGFCAVDSDEGTGDRYFGSANTNGSDEISAFYNLYDTKNTLYDETDDGPAVGTSANFFKNLAAADTSMMANPSGYSMTNLTDCSAATIGGNTADPQYYHNRWWQMTVPGGMLGGHTYRLKTSSTDFAFPNDQKNKNGQNSFAIWTKATGGTPKIHGLGAMEAYSPLQQNASSVFYLAQIGAEHAGKSVAIKLWDPGDTNGLTSNIQILIPGTSGYNAATLSYTAAKGTTNTGANNCNATNVTGASSVTTNTGGSGGQLFNGCWVTIIIPIPATYTAPTPPGEAEPGWWKIQYNVGPGSANGFDLTTWQVEIRGNPVHLVLP